MSEMTCPRCQRANPEHAKFCLECGARLTLGCVQCGSQLPPDAKFCLECGTPVAAPIPAPIRLSIPETYTPRHLAERILTSKSALEGERKHITVLFADLKGSLELIATEDPEGARDVLDAVLERMMEAVHHYEGMVNEARGDGIMALFGAPLAHEDHALRACHAALRMQAAVKRYAEQRKGQGRPTVAIRIGLNSGEVVVRSIGSDLRMEYSAVGRTTHLAARMEQHAEPGSTLLTPATLRLVEGLVTVHPLGSTVIKGLSQPLDVFELTGVGTARTRLQVRELSPFVGRERELRLLLSRYGDAAAGNGQVVLIRGEPGIGKSRLILELKRSLGGERLTWLEGRCSSYGRDVSYLPIIDILKANFDLEEGDGEARIARKIDTGAGALGSELSEHVPYLKALLSVDPRDPAVTTMDPQMRKARIFEALRALAVSGSAVRPLVMLVEDLHWLDRLSEEFISYLVEAVPRRAILLLLTYRPGYEPVFGQRPYFTELRLASLSDRETGAMAEGLLEAGSVPADLQRIIAGKADGNPFFIEEIIRSLLEIGAIRRADSGYMLASQIEDVFIPDTVQDVIAARLDRLDEEPKRAVQTAAVIGREFTVRLLELTADVQGRLQHYLQELKALDLIYERSLYPELAYMFKHALTHDVAYNSLLIARRKVLHRLVGQAIEALYAQRLAEHYETLAYHWERAEGWDRALEYLVKSGDKALAAFAPQQAVTFYDRAVAVVERAPDALDQERAYALHSGRGQAFLLTSDYNRSVDSFQRMLEVARAVGDRIQEGTALRQMAYALYCAHRFEDALDCAERARRLALETDDQIVLAGSLVTTAMVNLMTGKLEAGEAAAEEGSRAARRARSPLWQGFALYALGLASHWRGHSARALERIDEGLEIARQHQVPVVLVRLLFAEGIARCSRGEYQQALQYFQEELDLSARLGERAYRCRSLNSIGWVYNNLCNWDLAVEYNARSAAEARRLGDPELYRNAELNLADAYLGLGRLDDAERYLLTVERESRQEGTLGATWMKWRYTQHLHASLGELWLARGDPERALGFADACLDAAVATSSGRNIVKARRLRGEALVTQGSLDHAETELEEALRVGRNVGNPAQLWMTLAAFATLRQAQGRQPEAAVFRHEAVTIVEQVASALSDQTLRDTLLVSPQVSSLR